ncbi:MAG: alpha/beta hydrolase [Anaerolineae bacterium]|nr:alpha/beta hydrolase [Anaerolineae bacterium]
MSLPDGYTESFFETGEVPLHVIEGPQAGPPLVLLHGATGSSMEWLPLLSHLAAHWHVFALDLRGHGQSGRPGDLEGYHISHNAQDTLAFLRERVLQPAVLIGHSYGALTAMLTGMPGKDRLRALVLEDPPLLLRRPDDGNHTTDYFDWVHKVCRSASTIDQIIVELEKKNPSIPVETLRPWAQNLSWLDPDFVLAITTGDRRETIKGVDFEAHAQGITCPVLLMQADPELSTLLPKEDIDFFLANARDVQVVTFPGAGHSIHVDQPAKFLKVLDEFLANLAAG